MSTHRHSSRTRSLQHDRYRDTNTTTGAANPSLEKGERRQQEEQAQDWTKVNRKKKAQNKTTKKPAVENNTKFKRSLPNSISVKPENGEMFSDILKAIKQKVDINAIGSQVSSIIRES